MRLRTHILTSALLGFALYPRSPRKLALLFASGVGLDADHYLVYALRSGNWNPRAALDYDSWRHAPRSPNDRRKRYGSMRSVFHDARITLPPVWLAAWRWPILRPVAAGITLHLALDLPFLRFDWRVWRRAKGRCERCGRSGVERDISYVVMPKHGGSRWSVENRAAWCRKCRFEMRGY